MILSLLFLLSVCPFISPMMHETILAKKKIAIDRLKILSYQVQPKAQIPSLKELVTLKLAYLNEPGQVMPKGPDLPDDLTRSLINHLKHNNAVQLLKTLRLEPVFEEKIGNEKNRIFLSADYKYLIKTLWRPLNTFIYNITDGTQELLGQWPLYFYSITHDNKYVCLYNDSQLTVIDLDSKKIVATFNEVYQNFKLNYYVAFDAKKSTCFFVQSLDDNERPKHFAWAFNTEEMSRQDDDIYILESDQISYQWRHHFNCLQNRPESLADALPFRSYVCPDLMDIYWTTVFNNYLKALGIIKEFQHASGSITPDGRYLAMPSEDDTFIVLDMHKLDDFNMEKNIFKLGKKKDIEPQEIRRVQISPRGNIALISLVYMPLDQKDLVGVARVLSTALCLFDLKTREWVILMDRPVNPRYFWFNSDGNSFEVYSVKGDVWSSKVRNSFEVRDEKLHYRYDLTKIAPDMPLQKIKDLLSQKTQSKLSSLI